MSSALACVLAFDRDLKPENLLLVTRDDDNTIKLADFGFATKVWRYNTVVRCKIGLRTPCI